VTTTRYYLNRQIEDEITTLIADDDYEDIDNRFREDYERRRQSMTISDDDVFYLGVAAAAVVCHDYGGRLVTRLLYWVCMLLAVSLAQ